MMFPSHDHVRKDKQMHKSQIIKQQKSSAGVYEDQIIYMTVKSRTRFESPVSELKCVILVKTSRNIIFQSKTITITIKDKKLIPKCSTASQQAKTAESIFYDAVYGDNKIIQLPLF